MCMKRILLLISSIHALYCVEQQPKTFAEFAEHKKRTAPFLTKEELSLLSKWQTIEEKIRKTLSNCLS